MCHEHGRVRGTSITVAAMLERCGLYDTNDVTSGPRRCVAGRESVDAVDLAVLGLQKNLKFGGTPIGLRFPKGTFLPY